MRVICAAFVLALAACGPPDAPDAPRQTSVFDRQQPSSTTPGITISGGAEFGVKRRF